MLSRVDAGGRQPVHGFSSGIGVYKGCLEIGLELSESSKQQGGQSLLVVDFCPGGSGSLLHIGQGKGDFSIIIIVEGMVDQKIKSDRVQPGLGGFGFSIVFIGTSDAYFGNPRT